VEDRCHCFDCAELQFPSLQVCASENRMIISDVLGIK